MSFWNGSNWEPDEGTIRKWVRPSRWQTVFDRSLAIFMAFSLPAVMILAALPTAAGVRPGMGRDLVVNTDGSATISGESAIQWAGYAWRGQAPISVALVSYLTQPGFEVAVNQAASSWSASDVVDVTVGGRAKRQIVLYEGEYGLDRPAAWTQIYKRNGYITSATIYVNDTKMTDVSAWMMQFAICHEVGHGLGLAHQMNAIEPSCLSPALPGTTPNAEDYAQLDLIY